jgi:hypothetical protein
VDQGKGRRKFDCYAGLGLKTCETGFYGISTSKTPDSSYEQFHNSLGHDGTNALHEARPEVFLDARLGSREQGLVMGNLELLPELVVGDLSPVALITWPGTGAMRLPTTVTNLRFPGTVVGCYLLRHGIATGKHCLTKFKHRGRPYE